MVTTTALSIIGSALRTIGVLAVGESPTAAQGQNALLSLNSWIDSLGTQTQSMYHVAEIRSTCASGEASYSIGDTTPASDFDVARPLWIQSAAYVNPGSSPEVLVPLPVISDQMNQAQQVPTQTNSPPTTLYYQPTTGEVGEIILWPVLTQDVDVILFITTFISQFPALSTSVVMPTGYDRAFRWNLAQELLAEYGRTDPAVMSMVRSNALSSLADLKRSNTRLLDLSMDAGLLTDPTAGWNIQVGP